ncbi:translation initiation factor IF-2-like isoform X2 [Tyto alba]|uniref:translation initiation factor IF-2-like isoform X2 n=1 Tax=Tyto alba TaxID=56313 RepID=UPI001402C604|nr:translation initiation factor IF-2-like isoform X2 [Tyto alba]
MASVQRGQRTGSSTRPDITSLFDYGRVDSSPICRLPVRYTTEIWGGEHAAVCKALPPPPPPARARIYLSEGRDRPANPRQDGGRCPSRFLFRPGLLWRCPPGPTPAAGVCLHRAGGAGAPAPGQTGTQPPAALHPSPPGGAPGEGGMKVYDF